MGIRAEEIKRLISYANGLHVKVSFKPYTREESAAASWSVDGTEIIVYRRPRSSKISIILSLIHELGHHLEFIHCHNRKPSIKLAGALDSDEIKKQRKIILDYEVKSSLWWETIYKETNLKFPIYMLHLQKHFDVWQYEMFYQYGEFPSGKENKIKMKELRSKYGKN